MVTIAWAVAPITALRRSEPSRSAKNLPYMVSAIVCLCSLDSPSLRNPERKLGPHPQSPRIYVFFAGPLIIFAESRPTIHPIYAGSWLREDVKPKEPLRFNAMSLKLTSPAFEDGGAIPHCYTRNGPNLSPPLAWTGVPQGCVGFALICEDETVPRSKGMHWLIYGIPPGLNELAEGIPPESGLDGGVRQGLNDYGRVGYSGPAPKGATTHRYRFTLFALDAPLSLSAHANRRELLRAINGSVIERAHIAGTFLRRRSRPRQKTGAKANRNFVGTP